MKISSHCLKQLSIIHLSLIHILEDFVNSLEKPRRVFLMVPAGQPVDDVLVQLSELLEEGDIIMDGGNSYFEDTNRRHKQMAIHGLKYFGVGVSGGEEGALKGPSKMCIRDSLYIATFISAKYLSICSIVAPFMVHWFI